MLDRFLLLLPLLLLQIKLSITYSSGFLSCCLYLLFLLNVKGFTPQCYSRPGCVGDSTSVSSYRDCCGASYDFNASFPSALVGDASLHLYIPGTYVASYSDTMQEQ